MLRLKRKMQIQASCWGQSLQQATPRYVFVRQSCQSVRRKLHNSKFSVQANNNISGDIWVPASAILPDVRGGSSAPAVVSPGYDEHKARTPPPDLPSLMLDSRIVYLGMPLVPAVTELIIAELLYLQYKDRAKPMYLYINSTGTTRADGETVGFETEGTAIYDTMRYVKNEIFTVGVGVAIGQACMLLSAGTQGKRFMLPHATAMLLHPRVPPTGQRQAIEVHIKWKEVLAQKQAFLEIMNKTTGHSLEKLDADMQRPLYMQPIDALEYGIIDKIVKPEKDMEFGLVDQVKSADQWDKEAGLVKQ
eukprot:TRINITY_DN5460_c0_g1_i5.p1 TRINITY_DN5460_c0_g1~~TRINITY_DN5460_c0_g1_i5.p1  ORF type:complete len:305 (-),score=57.75 TRINITY_DN5460_c0_g1_i5:270-1184(-)